MTYDPHVIQEMAGRLYAQAARLVFLGVFLGGLVGLTAGITIALSVSLPLLVGAFVGALLGGALGAAAMEQRALALKFQAQLALCQVQIEMNTRK